ncbi:PLDc N-terminal domain-containing protein [Alteromonas genovensis]|uniref:PLDc N-terminal domain-containing protein n=2 Tax=Alteromonas TaxID=226 RepID=UPI001268829A
MLIILGVFWFVPLFVIGKSNKVGKNEKLAWILATLFVSWLSFIIYLLLAPLKPNDK